ncbi:hypothetical protein CYMTET_20035 [Cymbomonas tetramitiformis]|uniref:Uncharacterized protein n=1 Tax=Cymbomonas tetramitiformis TaxID=36881 RepID=A0AAE0G4X5_9CHLO|nr:hypothetical protein CYMTET_20035 [Cymbomonas tetramitiformis]
MDAEAHGKGKEGLLLLQAEKDRLENALLHLRRSNTELKEALKEGPDSDFEEAIRENEAVMCDMSKKIEDLRIAIEAGLSESPTPVSVEQPASTEQAPSRDDAESGQWL